MLRQYYALTKPGIIRGNLLTAAGGLLLASGRNYDAGITFGLLTGLALVIAAGCVINNITDRRIDARMQRTRTRGLATGSISVSAASTYAAALGTSGLAVLYIFTNTLTTGLAAFGLFAYTVLYGWAKRRSDYGTLVGSISGAVPIMAGYTAVTNRLDSVALLLGIILVAWQMPHFYAIALYRKKEYAAANIPVLPITRGSSVARSQSIGYIIVFGIAVAMLTLGGTTGLVFLVCMSAATAWWLRAAMSRHTDHTVWGRTVFRRSLLVISLFSGLLIFDGYLL